MSTEIIKQKRGRKAKIVKKEEPDVIQPEGLHHCTFSAPLITPTLLSDKYNALEKCEGVNVVLEKENEEKETEEKETEEKETEEKETKETKEEKEDIEPAAPKKRGRKPKGGKIIQQIAPVNSNTDNKQNIILHLKCYLKDIKGYSAIQSTIDGFAFQSNKNDLSYEIISSNDNCSVNNKTTINHDINNNRDLQACCDEEEDFSKDIGMKDVWKKLKTLEHNLHINNISDKKSACFWCTYEFDNPPIYIPKHFVKDSYHVYGCFCSPECAAAHLMEENIDSSAKFERYHLINHIYAKIYDYKKNIKPAPNPYYILDKYYGNLSIQEYRALLRNERLFLVVDKPLTRILPELHEDNDDFIINNKVIPSNTYQIKKKLQRKQQTKSNIVNEKFGLNSY
jgi:hypothetical protein